MKIKTMLFIALAYIIVTVSFAGIYVSFQKSEEFGFIIIDPNQETETIFVVCILARSFTSTSNDSWVTVTDFGLSVAAKYNFSEKSLFIELFSYETATGEIIPHPNVTAHFIDIEIIKENYFLQIRLSDFFATRLSVRVCQELLNYTIQPLTFYKLEVLN